MKEFFAGFFFMLFAIVVCYFSYRVQPDVHTEIYQHCLMRGYTPAICQDMAK